MNCIYICSAGQMVKGYSSDQMVKGCSSDRMVKDAVQTIQMVDGYSSEQNGKGMQRDVVQTGWLNVVHVRCIHKR